jgi:tRNA(Ile)-lysidine synthase
LREGSDEAAASAKQWAQEAGFSTHVLRWRGAKPKANIEEKARAARYLLMAAWCKAHGAKMLFTAHTKDDQAETFLLRLARGSGVDGLAAMRACGPVPVLGFTGIHVLRPLLSFTRGELREFLTSRGASWLEDPMNEDPRFMRARVRALLPALEAAGVPVSRIAEAAGHLARAREALNAQTAEFLAAYARFEPGGRLFLDAGALGNCGREIGLRALAEGLMRVSGQTYRPRFERLERLFEALVSGGFAKARTLHSCRVGLASKAESVFGRRTLKITKENLRNSPPQSGADLTAKPPKGSSSRAKSPQKGHSLHISYNS